MADQVHFVARSMLLSYNCMGDMLMFDKTNVAYKVGPRSMNNSGTSFAARRLPRWLVAGLWPLLLLLLSTLLAGGCSLSNLPVAGTRPASPSAQASPTPASPSGGPAAKVTPRATSTGQAEQPAQATQAPSGSSGGSQQ